MADLAIRKDACNFDFLSLGALVHRLDPGVIPFRKARSVEIHVSGGEYNVAANLADCFGLKTAIATAMVNYPIGELVEGRVREMGVVPLYKRFQHDGVRGPNIATVYSDRGQGVRPPVVFYNRANEAGALLKRGDFDWKKIFSGGVRWFHSGGIFAALSETTSDLILEGIEAAKAAGAIVSFDLNYRAKLWSSVGGTKRANEVLRRIVSNCDAVIGNEEDLQKGLGIPGPDVAAKSKLDANVFFKLIESVVEQFPNIKLVATTLREVHSTNRHDWGRRAVAQWPAPRESGDAVGRARPHRRRRRICRRLDLRLNCRTHARRSPPAGLGARRIADNLPGRHHHGEARRGRGPGQGWLGKSSALKARSGLFGVAQRESPGQGRKPLASGANPGLCDRPRPTIRGQNR